MQCIACCDVTNEHSDNGTSVGSTIEDVQCLQTGVQLFWGHVWPCMGNWCFRICSHGAPLGLRPLLSQFLSRCQLCKTGLEIAHAMSHVCFSYNASSIGQTVLAWHGTNWWTDGLVTNPQMQCSHLIQHVSATSIVRVLVVSNHFLFSMQCFEQIQLAIAFLREAASAACHLPCRGLGVLPRKIDRCVCFKFNACSVHAIPHVARTTQERTKDFLAHFHKYLLFS